MPEAAPIHYVAERAGRMPPILSTLHALGTFVDLFKSRRRLEVENLFLSHQLGIALRRAPPRLRLCGSDWRCYAPLEIRLKRCEETGLNGMTFKVTLPLAGSTQAKYGESGIA